MKEFWRILKLIFAWIIGSAGVIIGLMVIFESDTWIQRIFTGLFILISLYIIPKISNWLRLGIRPKIIAIAFLVSFLGMVFTDSIKPSSQTEISEVDSVEQYYVTASKLNVRKGSGTNHDVVYKLEKGDKVEIISQTNDWTEIKTTQGQGYVSSKYISTEKPESSETPEWLTYLIIGGIILYGLFSKKGGAGSGGSSKPRSTPTSRPSSKPKPQKPKHICKHCGFENESLQTLTALSCSKSPTGKHQPFEGGVQSKYICKDCGFENKSLQTLTALSCSKSTTGKHRPFEGGIQPKYYCKHCGFENSSMQTLTALSCSKSPTGKHQPLV